MWQPTSSEMSSRINMLKRWGDIRLPCRTPHGAWKMLDMWLFHRTLTNNLPYQHLIMSTVGGGMPATKNVLGLYSSQWFTLSNAFLRSSVLAYTAQPNETKKLTTVLTEKLTSVHPIPSSNQNWSSLVINDSLHMYNIYFQHKSSTSLQQER